LLIKEQQANHLLPTIFELMLQEIQQVVDENCVVKE